MIRNCWCIILMWQKLDDLHDECGDKTTEISYYIGIKIIT